MCVGIFRGISQVCCSVVAKMPKRASPMPSERYLMKMGTQHSLASVPTLVSLLGHSVVVVEVKVFYTSICQAISFWITTTSKTSNCTEPPCTLTSPRVLCSSLLPSLVRIQNRRHASLADQSSSPPKEERREEEALSADDSASFSLWSLLCQSRTKPN